MVLKPVKLSEELLFKGLRFQVVRRSYAKSEGEVFRRDVVLFPEAVVVLPFIDGERIILIKQFRPSIEDYIVEVPAGVIDSGETPEEAARRELEEEIGYIPGELTLLGEYYPTPGYSTEKMYFYLARNLRYVGAKPEKYEIIEPFTVTLKEAYSMVEENVLKDMKTVLALLLYSFKHSIER
ncbi:NUDIX hydrolase [Thermosphaera chiliense]|uniref:NUDIX hydrolase n=1 Tax=Thermosphaera chiliense TaxID=3402707 RepID=A0A7M1UQW3_9CREN|nr:NUDIX hydrolase [Thermosphaera aggregans]QOR94369.1 NUDIX hydrolase [Thermosphaera aggregans]